MLVGWMGNSFDGLRGELVGLRGIYAGFNGTC